MRELITEALVKLEEKVLLLRTLETTLLRSDCRGENRYKIEERAQQTREHLDLIRQSIIDYACQPASQTHHSNLEGCVGEDVSFAQVQVNK